MASTTPSFECRDYIGNTFYLSSKPVGNYAVLVAETSAIRQALRGANWMKQGNIIVESDSQVVICSIMRKVEVSRQISNFIFL